MTLSIAQVAVDNATIHFDKLYSYKVPDYLEGRVWPGSMVLVPFGRGDKPRMAVVLGVEATEEEKVPKRLKTLHDAAPEQARLTPDLLELVRFLKDRTFCTWFEAVKAVIPYGAQYRAATVDGKPVMQNRLSRSTERVYRLAGELPQKPKPGPRQLAAVEALRNGPLTAHQLDEVGISKPTLDTLCEKGVLAVTQQDKMLDLFADIPFDPQPITLAEEQQRAYESMLPDLEDGEPHAALLHGVTGSGKTVVFLKLIQRTLELGRKALVLVPEISLTPQMIRRLKSTFGSRLAVQHSALNNTERLLQWRMIQQGNADIVVGTRSAIFSPLQNIGLIIIDEEQEHTYQSESAPRYDAHDVAKKRAAMEKSLLVFASATPLTETYHAAESGKYKLLTLTRRYGGRPLPQVDFIDMRAEMAAGNPREVSTRMARELQENLENGEQSILLLNRRGYHTVGMCVACGHVLKCPNCSVPLVYHKPQQALMCHHCGHTVRPLPQLCPECGGKLNYSGFGTQRVEEELSQLLPGARILRMDQDSTSQKNAHETMLAQFGRQEYDILLGTQMVAKGLDFEKVTLVGVLGIDSLLFGQGFRAYESVFSLVTQVIGRGGRAALPGRALIQTTVPNHPVLQLAAEQDYEAFYREEIAFRKFGLYPPYCSFCIVGFVGAQEGSVAMAAHRFGTLLAERAAQRPQMPLRLLGPAPMGITMLNGKYRYKLTLKCRNDAAFRALLRETLDVYAQEKLPQKASVILDFNSDGDL
ncbi:primosomal protein N' [Gemmiger formicilis]|uniref:replication restart helicase PriA n=1 Tax=Gemmiger formicilis TaxID=745368 RepID=UPI001959F5CD|nr:primosomal protein N' [Gemmiger formicilis]MBM6900098.1 primosomal protein N' [Gemmiger formicilis]